MLEKTLLKIVSMRKFKSIEQFKQFAHSKVDDYCNEVIGRDIREFLHQKIDELPIKKDEECTNFLKWLTDNYEVTIER